MCVCLFDCVAERQWTSACKRCDEPTTPRTPPARCRTNRHAHSRRRGAVQPRSTSCWRNEPCVVAHNAGPSRTRCAPNCCGWCVRWPASLPCASGALVRGALGPFQSSWTSLVGESNSKNRNRQKKRKRRTIISHHINCIE